jgi:acetolactate synthase-1/2/3 large subunit
MAETFPARMERGVGLPRIDRIPYVPEVALNQIGAYQAVVLAGAANPVTFFGYKDTPASLLTAGQETVALGEGPNAIAELSKLAEAVGAPSTAPENLLVRAGEIPLPTGPLARDKICAVLAALQPEGAVVVDEGNTTSMAYPYFATLAKPFTLLTLTGGAIGHGSPCATGAAVACPDRKVICFQADGSALYTLQALWTQAKENLDVVTLICSNQSYDVLKFEASRLGTHPLGPTVKTLTDLSGVDWVQLGRGMGVPSVAVATAEELASELSKAFAEKGPRLIEMKFTSPM